ncbi:MAG: hypothetical protein IJD38_03215 [Clostridia bacterium]|nr:hypothetical protein [Clostridia bacterium]
MLSSEIRVIGDRPTLYLDDHPATPMAYTTYFEERSDAAAFAGAGYRIFFVNLSFTSLPINSFTGFTPFRVGAFEDPAAPDFSEFETAVRAILAACPDAVIFPRIYVSMPKSWVDAHPDDVIPTPKGGRREVLFSDAFRHDGAELLRRTVEHIRKADYANRVGGWQLCGGQTQEWFHHDLGGSLGHAAYEPYRHWLREQYGEENGTLPTPEDYADRGSPLQTSENARRYALFSNLAVAETVEHFARTLKEAVNGEQIVGVFYGYTMESNGKVLFGSHALRRLLNSPYIDFFSSPNAYLENRAFGMDWADMIPVDSVKLHGKLSFIECDIRTHLTEAIQNVRPGEYPDGLYRLDNGTSVWAGPPTAELSREALRKCFAHQITRGSAIWWFDMWGGWYRAPLLMEELTAMKAICDGDLYREKGTTLTPEVAVLADERSYASLLDHSPLMNSLPYTRMALGNTGIPYDLCACEDAEAILHRYKAVIFPFPAPSDAGKCAMTLCRERGIPYLTATPSHPVLTVAEIRDFCDQSGVHAYTPAGDVVYVGNGYVGLHAAKAGEKFITLPKTCRVIPLFGTDVEEQTTDTVRFTLDKHRTALFAVEPTP